MDLKSFISENLENIKCFCTDNKEDISFSNISDKKISKIEMYKDFMIVEYSAKFPDLVKNEKVTFVEKIIDKIVVKYEAIKFIKLKGE